MAFKEEMEQLSVKESKFQNSKAKLVNFSYTQAAYEDDTLVNGVDEYSFEQEQNIPNGTSEVLSTNQAVLNKGVRSQASSLTRQLINHFFGRTSYNLNKIHDHFNSFISKFSAALGKENGVATLDANGRVPYSQLPESAVEIKGTWNASTNRTSIVTEEEPQGTQLINGTGTMGDFYICTAEGWFDASTGNASATETEGYEHYVENDRVMYIDGIWKRIPSGSDGAIAEINGKSGSEVTLFGTDITVSESDMRTIKQALDEAGSQITFDNEPTENSSNAATSGGIWSAALGGRIPDSSITSFDYMYKPGRYYIAKPNDYSSFPTDWGTVPGILLVLSKNFAEDDTYSDYMVTQIFIPANEDRAFNYFITKVRKYRIRILGSSVNVPIVRDWTLIDLDSLVPEDHASTEEKYGLGSTTEYGHVKTVDDLDQDTHTDGLALSAHQGNVLASSFKQCSSIFCTEGNNYYDTENNSNFYIIDRIKSSDNNLYLVSKSYTPLLAFDNIAYLYSVGNLSITTSRVWNIYINGVLILSNVWMPSMTFETNYEYRCIFSNTKGSTIEAITNVIPSPKTNFTFNVTPLKNISAGTRVKITFTHTLISINAIPITISINSKSSFLYTIRNGKKEILEPKKFYGIEYYWQPYTTLELLFDGTHWLIVSDTELFSYRASDGSVTCSIKSDGLIEQWGKTTSAEWHDFPIVYNSVPSGWSSYISGAIYADTCCCFIAETTRFYLAFARNLKNNMYWKAIGY